MIKPEFPYKGNQVIVTSERLVFHSRKDGIYLFGKATIGLSSVGTINLDSKEGVKIDAPYIELGLNAQTLGEQVVLGNTMVSILSEFNSAISLLADALSKVDGTTRPTTALSMAMLNEVGMSLKMATDTFTARLNTVLSDITYTT
jgi:hypothetical protein